MIVRITHDAQYRLDESALPALEQIDERLEEAVQTADEARFGSELERLLDAVRTMGERLGDDELVASDLILPPDDMALAELSDQIAAEGFIPDT